MGNGIDNELGRAEIHVGHPKGQHVGVAEDALAGIPLDAGGAGTVHHLVEVILHRLWFF